jgi:hypothetical protein
MTAQAHSSPPLAALRIASKVGKTEGGSAVETIFSTISRDIAVSRLAG